MRLSQLLHEAGKGVLLHPVRSVLSIGGLLLAVAAVLCIMTVLEGARQHLLRRLAILGTDTFFVRQRVTVGAGEVNGDRAGDMVVRLGMADRIRGVSSLVTDVGVLHEVPAAEAALGDAAVVLGVDDGYFRVRRARAAQGRVLCKADMERKASVCVLGAEVARAKHPQGDSIGATVRIGGDEFRIVGVLAREGTVDDPSLGAILRSHDWCILIPITTTGASASMPLAQLAVSEIGVRIASDSLLEAGVAVCQRSITGAAPAPGLVETVVPRQLVRREREAQQVLAYLVAAVGVLGVIVGASGIGSVMTAGVAERTKEIGIRRAIGATRAQIAVQFLLEAVLIASVGGSVGLSVGLASTFVIAQWSGWPVALTSASVGMALSVAWIAGLAAGVYPAWRASKLNPADAFRYG